MPQSPVLRTLGRRLRLGVIGGGGAALIGPVHRVAARLDDHIEIVAAPREPITALDVQSKAD